MMKAKILTSVGVAHLAVATLLSLTFLGRLLAPVASSALGFTPTPTSTATATPTPTAPTTATPATTPVAPTPTPVSSPPRLTIAKTASSAEVLPGGLVTFSIEVCNEGDRVAENVVVSDALPSELDLVSASASQGAVVVEGNGMRAELGSIWPGYCATVSITARVHSDVAPGTQIRNVASVGDLYDDATLTAVGLLPESGSRSASLFYQSGRVTPLTVVAGLMGVAFLAIGAVLKRRC